MQEHHGVHAMFDQLTDEERATVLATLEDDLARGWIPKPAELAGIIASARSARDAQTAIERECVARRRGADG